MSTLLHYTNIRRRCYIVPTRLVRPPWQQIYARGNYPALLKRGKRSIKVTEFTIERAGRPVFCLARASYADAIG